MFSYPEILLRLSDKRPSVLKNLVFDLLSLNLLWQRVVSAGRLLAGIIFEAFVFCRSYLGRVTSDPPIPTSFVVVLLPGYEVAKAQISNKRS